MITETPYRVVITCDHSDCVGSTARTAYGKDRESCNKLLFDLGWRLYGKNNLCPVHAVQAMRTLAALTDRTARA